MITSLCSFHIFFRLICLQIFARDICPLCPSQLPNPEIAQVQVSPRRFRNPTCETNLPTEYVCHSVASNSYPSKNTGRTSTQPRPPQHKNLHISVLTGPSTDILNAGNQVILRIATPFAAFRARQPRRYRPCKIVGRAHGVHFRFGGSSGAGGSAQFFVNDRRISKIIQYFGVDYHCSHCSLGPRGVRTQG